MFVGNIYIHISKFVWVIYIHISKSQLNFILNIAYFWQFSNFPPLDLVSWVFVYFYYFIILLQQYSDLKAAFKVRTGDAQA